MNGCRQGGGRRPAVKRGAFMTGADMIGSRGTRASVAEVFMTGTLITGTAIGRAAALALALLAVLFSAFPSGVQGAVMSREAAETDLLAAKVRITGEKLEAVVALYDSPASRDFLSLLPMTATFRDYAGEEKIAYLPRKLATGGVRPGGGGDFAYFAPWGNLAVFYKGMGQGGGGLHILGRIESGKEGLAGRNEDFSARLELAE